MSMAETLHLIKPTENLSGEEHDRVQVVRRLLDFLLRCYGHE